VKIRNRKRNKYQIIKWRGNRNNGINGVAGGGKKWQHQWRMKANGEKAIWRK